MFTVLERVSLAQEIDTREGFRYPDIFALVQERDSDIMILPD